MRIAGRFSMISVTLFLLNFLLTPIYSQEKILRFSHLTIEDGLPQNTVHTIIKDKYGFMWFGTMGGLSKYDGYKITNYYTDAGDSNSIINNRIQEFYKDSLENIWISFMDVQEFCRYNYETDNFTRFMRDSMPGAILDTLDKIYQTIKIVAKTKEYTWYTKRWQPNAENWYLHQINNKTGSQSIYKDNQPEKWAINDKLLNYVYLDNNQILWAGGFSGGVNFSDTRAKPFYRFANSANVKFYIIDNFTRAICEDNDRNLWIGTFKNGITKINRKTNEYNYYVHSDNNANSLIDNSIRKIFCDSKGYIWIGTKEGLDKLDPRNDQFHHYSTKFSKGFPNDWVFSVVEDRDSNIWIGTFKGIAKYNRRNDTFFAYEPNGTLNHQSVRAMITDRYNNIWVGTEGGGITKLSRGNTKAINEKLQPSFFLFSTTNLNLNRVYALAEDENGILWVGTGGGLVRFDPGNNSFKVISTHDGLLSESIVGVLCDYKGHVWFSHRRGLSKIDISGLNIRNYTLNDGLQSLEFSEDAYFRNNKTGEMFFGGIGGFNTFFPDSIKDNPYPPPIVFTQLKVTNIPVGINQLVNGRKILTKSLLTSKEITLTHKDKNFSIEFAALHYSDSKENKYQYMLEGFDKEWITTDASKRVAEYSNLDPKTYIFKVRAANCDGVWNDKICSMVIIVETPWWQSLWFKIVIAVLIIGIFAGFYYIRVSVLSKQKIQLEKLVQERTHEIEEKNIILTEQTAELEVNNEQLNTVNATKDKFFSIIAHDLKSPLSSIMGFCALLIKRYDLMNDEKRKSLIQVAHDSSKNLYRLLDNLLQWARTQTGVISFNPEEIILKELVDSNISLLENQILEKQLGIEINFDENIKVHADRNMIDSVIRNLVTNAIKFTDSGSISINAQQEINCTNVSIIDTGIGIDKNMLYDLFDINQSKSTTGTKGEIGSGLGLILCKEFVAKNGGTISVKSEPGKGSTFSFTIPNQTLSDLG